MQLPEYGDLDIAKLSSVFRDTTNSYKFYWFLSILDSLRDNGQNVISLNDIAIRMLANVWYPLDYFKLSFGKEDSFKNIAHFITSKIKIDNSPNAPTLLTQINKQLDLKERTGLSEKVRVAVKYVPYRFVRPFFEVETKGLIDHKVKESIINLLTANFDNQPHKVIYRFIDDSIELNMVWVDYFQKHQIILRGFIAWHLVRFLQKNNPNVIGLSEKLVKPSERNLSLANRFWKDFLRENTDLTCIYSGEVITTQNLSLDHFLPWSYVAHDQLWNIIPTLRNVNSTKSDWLPSFDFYFDRFSNIQYQAFQFYLTKLNYNILEDYNYLFSDNLQEISFETFREMLQKQLFPQLQTARNMGFSYPFIFEK